MSFNSGQFRSLVGRVLSDFDGELASEDAVSLVLGTAAVESQFGTYLRQLGNGPALSVFQIEMPTFEWLQSTFSRKYPEISDIKFRQIEWDLRSGIIFCRLRYRVDPEPLPSCRNVLAMAEYWKRVYNTRLGKGTVKGFLAAYKRYVQ